jgi:hypothetical protein
VLPSLNLPAFKKPQSTNEIVTIFQMRTNREASMTTRYALGAAILGFSLLPFASAPASANLAAMTQTAVAADADPFVSQVQRRGGAVRVNRSVNVNRNFNRNVHVNRNISRNVNRNISRNVYVNRNVRVNRAVVTGGRGLYRGAHYWHGGRRWVRPRNYWWPVGGAIAAGAAIGVIAASSAYWAGAAPAPGYCWYYTDPSMRQGFWDVCQ